MNCDCLNTIDNKLREQNLRLSGYAFIFPTFTAIPQIATQWIERDKAPKGKRRSPTPMLASHCPFCGVKIELPKKEDK